jgi:hypothetical protein
VLAVVPWAGVNLRMIMIYKTLDCFRIAILSAALSAVTMACVSAQSSISGDVYGERLEPEPDA